MPAFRRPNSKPVRLRSRVRVEGKLVTRPITSLRRKSSEAELLRGAKPHMVRGEIDWGRPVGKEIW